jgi:hypothetical protein
MVLRSRESKSERGDLKIRGLRGGTVSEITNFLVDLEHAHNSLFFYQLEVSVYSRSLRTLTRYAKFELGVLGLPFSGNYFGRSNEQLELDRIPPGLRLELSHVVLNSPGFWEFLGALNPLQQIREYLNDRHERRKDKSYREAAEAERLRLDNELIQRQIWEKDFSIFRDQVEFAREVGIEDEALKHIVWQKVGQPLSRLGRHQDNGLIQGSSTHDDIQ